MWLQIKEPVFKQISQKALALGGDISLSSGYHESRIEETIDEFGRKLKKTYMRATGYKELGYNGWYLVS